MALIEGSEAHDIRKKRKVSMSENNSSTCDIENVCLRHQETILTTGRKFLHFHKMKKIYETEDWQQSGSTMFMPLKDDLMVNTVNIEQFSCTHGSFFVAGTNGHYAETLQGNVLHLWRFCALSKKLYISRSFLFKNSQDFLDVQQALLRL